MHLGGGTSRNARWTLCRDVGDIEPYDRACYSFMPQQSLIPPSAGSGPVAAPARVPQAQQVLLTPTLRLSRMARRFLLPRFVTRLLYLVRFRAVLGPLAEVEYSRLASWGPGCVISSFTKVKINGPFRMGRRVHIASGGFIEVSAGGLDIGNDVLVGPNCSILTSKYTYDRVGIPLHEQAMTSVGVSIGDRTWIGAGSAILDGSRIGEDCIVSAGSVVSGVVPARSILLGNPAKVIFTRR